MRPRGVTASAARDAAGLQRRPRPRRARAAPDAPPTAARTSWRWPRPASTPPRRTSPRRLDALEFPARERDVVVAAATRARALAPVLAGTDERRRSGRCCGARRPRRSRWPGRWARPSRRSAGSTTSATPARDHRRRPAGRRPRGPGDRPRARRRDGGDARRRDRDREAQLRGGAGGLRRTMSACDLPAALHAGDDEHIGAALPRRRGAVLDPPRRRLRGPVRLAQPRPADRRPGRERRREPRPVRPRRSARRANASSTAARSTRRLRAVTPEPPGAGGPAARARGRAGDRAGGRAGARVRGRLPAGAARRRRRGGRAARRLARAGRRGSSPRASRRCASSAATGPITAALGPARARLLLRGRRGGPRARSPATTRASASATSTSPTVARRAA